MISIIIPYRNRDVSRVERCLASLSAQSFKKFEVVFIDNGSEADQAKNVKNIVEQFNFCRYIYSHTQGMIWSRGYALNIGIKQSIGDIVLMADIDLIFEPDFLLKTSELNFEHEFYNYRCIYLDADFSYHNLSWNYLSYSLNKNSGDSRGLLIADKKHLLAIQGYDEYYKHWGCEDDDICKRLIAIGLTQKYLEVSQYLTLHQWHIETSNNWPSAWYIQMVMYCSKNNTIERNPSGFGKVILPNERVDFFAYDSETQLQFQQYASVTSLNEIIIAFYKTVPNKLIKINYKTPQELTNKTFKKSIKSIILKYIIRSDSFNNYEKVMAGKYLTVERLHEFLVLFISMNRNNIADYNIAYEQDGSLTANILKK